MKKGLIFGSFVFALVLVLSFSFVSSVFENQTIQNSVYGSFQNTLPTKIINPFFTNQNGNIQNPQFQQNIIVNGMLTNDSQNLAYSQFSGQNFQQFQGYIIEFKEEPLTVRNVKLTEEAEENGAKGLRISPGTPVLNQPTLPANINAKLSKQRTAIQTEHSSFKSKAVAKLSTSTSGSGTFNSFLSLITGKVTSESKLKILGEYQNTFNGIALNISTSEAESLKTLSEVKAVYPNYVAHIELMDSVPQINADDVWKLDRFRNDCTTSGKSCLTGKGITIGIIDTGVDYTHEDLGNGCFGKKRCKVIRGYDFVNNDENPMD